jgi:hypothetical protein
MKKELIMENIYDVIKVCALNKSQSDGWADLSRKHAEEASKELYKFLRYKSIEWDGNIIRIGKHITLTITDNKED